MGRPVEVMAVHEHENERAGDGHHAAGPLGRRIELDADAVTIDPGIWAIHGWIPGEGEVILAEFHPPETASHALDDVLQAEAHLLITDITAAALDQEHPPFP